jgi:hypothetical protein
MKSHLEPKPKIKVTDALDELVVRAPSYQGH